MEQLYLGDCLDILPTLKDKSIDCILTDAPYGINFVSNHRKEKYRNIDNDNNLFWLPKVIDECFRISRDNTGHYFFCSFHNIDIFKQTIEKKFKIKNILVWEKNNTSMGDLKGDFAPKIEFIIFAQKGRSLIRGKRTPNIFKFKKTQNINHPTEKPVDLCMHLIEKFTDKNNTILDCFMGSGSTGVASKNLNRNFIGIEKDKDYFDIARTRINDQTKSDSQRITNTEI